MARKNKKPLASKLDAWVDNLKETSIDDILGKAATSLDRDNNFGKAISANKVILNYNYGFWRMTQLFGRSLFIKYFRPGVV